MDKIISYKWPFVEEEVRDPKPNPKPHLPSYKWPFVEEEVRDPNPKPNPTLASYKWPCVEEEVRARPRPWPCPP